MASKLSDKEKINALRAEMRAEKIDGFIVPRVDIYQGEFVPECAERLAWLTGFTGSAGAAVILKDKAVVLTDGRYTIQLSQQIDKKLYHAEDTAKKTVSAWAAQHAKKGDVIGYDPWLYTPRQLEVLRDKLAEKSVSVKAVTNNLIDRIWKDRPEAPGSAVTLFPENIAGSTAVKKIQAAAKILAAKNIFAQILNMPDSLAWLLNVRGNDMATTPVALSLGILYANGGLQWFIDPARVGKAVKAQIGGAEIIDPAALAKHIDALGAKAKKAGLAVGLDFARAPVWFKERIEMQGAEVTDSKDPCIMPRALKTKTERKAIRDAHIRDGVAMVKFLNWLEEAAPKGKLTEISVAEKLEEFRKGHASYKGPSFDTISGFGPNGAIVHYRATPETSRAIKAPGILLLDSGGQYQWGTTDITRTIAIGIPTVEMRRNNTLVLKGHIAMARARFPEGTTGAQIDALARQPLWNANLDYAHGTGHGVGCYLSVHEEAASISSRGQEPLKAGMLISNEPGYYKENHYGIRIENLVFVKEGGKPSGKASKAGAKMLEFETVTLVPLDRKLIDADMLTSDERAWMNEYHARVYKTLAPKLDKKLKAWLERRTRGL